MPHTGQATVPYLFNSRKARILAPGLCLACPIHRRVRDQRDCFDRPLLSALGTVGRICKRRANAQYLAASARAPGKLLDALALPGLSEPVVAGPGRGPGALDAAAQLC
jgi:hypothetical protein